MGSVTTAALFLRECIDTEEASFSILLTYSSHFRTGLGLSPTEHPRLGYEYILPDAYMRCKADTRNASNKIVGHASEERQRLMPSCAWWD